MSKEPQKLSSSGAAVVSHGDFKQGISGGGGGGGSGGGSGVESLKTNDPQDIADLFQLYPDLWDMLIEHLADAQTCQDAKDVCGERQALGMACNTAAIALRYHVPAAIAARPEWSLLLDSFSSQQSQVQLTERVLGRGGGGAGGAGINLVDLQRAWMQRFSDLCTFASCASALSSSADAKKKKGGTTFVREEKKEPWQAHFARTLRMRLKLNVKTTAFALITPATFDEDRLLGLIDQCLEEDDGSCDAIGVCRGQDGDKVRERTIFVLDARHPPGQYVSDSTLVRWKWQIEQRASAQAVVICLSDECKCCWAKIRTVLSPTASIAVVAAGAAAPPTIFSTQQAAQECAYGLLSKFCQAKSPEAPLVDKYIVPLCNLLCDCLLASGRATRAVVEKLMTDWMTQSCDRPLDAQSVAVDGAQHVALSLAQQRWSPGMPLSCAPLIRHFVLGMEPDSKAASTHVRISCRASFALPSVPSNAIAMVVDFSSSVAAASWPLPWTVLQEGIRRSSSSSSSSTSTTPPLMNLLHESQLKMLFASMYEIHAYVCSASGNFEIRLAADEQAVGKELVQALYHAWLSVPLSFDTVPHIKLPNVTQTATGGLALGQIPLSFMPVPSSQVLPLLWNECRGCLEAASKSDSFSILNLSLLDAMHVYDSVVLAPGGSAGGSAGGGSVASSKGMFVPLTEASRIL